jgi:hypothetical protein
MDVLSKMVGWVRGLTPFNFGADTPLGRVAINPRGDVLIAESLPPGVELVRLGKSWQVRTAAAFAALAAVPSAAAALSLYNNYSDGDTPWCLLIESVFATKIAVDVTQVNQFSLWGMNNITGVTKPADSSLAIRSLSGRKSYDGKAFCSVALAVTDEGWFPLGNSPAQASAVAGSPWATLDEKLKPLHIVQPKGMYNLHVTTVGAAAGQFHCGIRFHEAQLRVMQ